MSSPSNRIAGISGGRTSARMAFDLPEDTVLTFQNTGEEDERTLEFLCRLEDDLGREIVRLEWRPPPKPGDPPKMASFAVLSHRELARMGEPFRALLQSLANYRATKGLPPVAPWARRRLCTAYLKIRTQHRYAESIGFDPGYTCYVGLRYDEPDRVAKYANVARKNVETRFPLFDARVTRSDVFAFWATKPYGLAIPEYLGNCKGCFLKDERDLASALLETGDAERWVAIERDFQPMRRGGRPSYAQVIAEAPARMLIRAAVRASVGDDGTFTGQDVPHPEGLSASRRRLILLQERKPNSDPFSCGCEGAEMLAEDDDYDEAP